MQENAVSFANIVRNKCGKETNLKKKRNHNLPKSKCRASKPRNHFWL